MEYCRNFVCVMFSMYFADCSLIKIFLTKFFKMKQLTDLIQNLQLQIISYLDVSTTFSSLSRVSKQLFVLIFSEKFIPYTMLNQLIGNDFQQEFYSSKEYTYFFKLLQQVYNPNCLHNELPFYAFKSNTGCDQNSPTYFFNHIFKSQHFQSVCTKEGSNFHIEGALAYEFYEPYDLHKIEDIPLSKDKLGQLGVNMNERNEDIVREILEMNPTTTYEYELPYQPIDKVGIIKHIKVSRSGMFSCPLKTLMLYVANEKVEQDDPIIKLIGSPTTPIELRGVYMNHGHLLPQIYFTNVELLRPWAELYSQSNDLMSVVVFKNSNRAKKAKPMAWIQFNIKDRKIFEFKLECGNFFSGRHVLLNLINCEDLMAESEEVNMETNIDVNYVSLRGSLL